MLLHSSTLSVIAASAFVSLASASPVPHTAELETRQTVNCTDPAAFTFQQCWDQLDVSGYLGDAKKGWNVTTRVCSASDDGAGCCHTGEPWSTCFLRLATGVPGYDCTTMSPHFCTNIELDTSLGSNIEPMVRYTVTAIQAINYFITDYWKDLQTGLRIPDLSSVVSGDVQLNDGNMAKAVLASLPFWGTPSVEAGGPQGTKSTFNADVIQTFSQSLDQAKDVSSGLFTGPFDAKDNNNNLDAALQRGVSAASTPLETALTLIMSDLPTFLDFAAHGRYTGINALSMYRQSQNPGLSTAVSTYAISEVLSQNKFSATPMAPLDKVAFQYGRQCTAFGDVCQGDDSKTFYWSNVTQREYQISFSGSWARDNKQRTTYALLENLETSTSVYMPTLFDGAYNCTLTGKAGGSVVNFNDDGTLDLSCLSAVPVYLAHNDPCPDGAVQVEGKCPFGFNS